MVAMILVILVAPVQDQAKAAFVPPAGYASDDACMHRCVMEEQPGRRSTDDPRCIQAQSIPVLERGPDWDAWDMAEDISGV